MILYNDQEKASRASCILPPLFVGQDVLTLRLNELSQARDERIIIRLRKRGMNGRYDRSARQAF
jgi:hypothetical protein